MTAVLSRPDIEALMRRSPPLLECCPDPEAQLQPNGVDITVRNIASMGTPGQIGVSNRQRQVSATAPLAFDADGFVDLTPGPYLITHNEIVHLPTNVMALARPRSSLLRCGVTVETAVWDAGYSGRSQSLLVVHHAGGFRLQKDARVAQLVFFRLTGETEGYRGVYQGENL
jgi:dUTP pyrophosphatase